MCPLFLFFSHSLLRSPEHTLSSRGTLVSHFSSRLLCCTRKSRTETTKSPARSVLSSGAVALLARVAYLLQRNFPVSTSQNVKNYYSAPLPPSVCSNCQGESALWNHDSRAGCGCGIAVVVEFSCCAVLACLYQTTHAQVLLDDDVVDGSHDESDLHGVGRTGEVSVDLLRRMLVEAGSDVLAFCSLDQNVHHNSRYKSVEDVVARGAVVLATLVVGEVVLHR